MMSTTRTRHWLICRANSIRIGMVRRAETAAPGIRPGPHGDDVGAEVAAEAGAGIEEGISVALIR